MCKQRCRYRDLNLAFMHEEVHLHLAGVLRSFEALRLNLDDATTKERQGLYLCVAEGGTIDLLSDDA